MLNYAGWYKSSQAVKPCNTYLPHICVIIVTLYLARIYDLALEWSKAISFCESGIGTEDAVLYKSARICPA